MTESQVGKFSMQDGRPGSRDYVWTQLATECWAPGATSSRVESSLPCLQNDTFFIGADLPDKKSEVQKPKVDGPKPDDEKIEKDLQQAVKAMADRFTLGDTVRYITTQIVDGEKHRPGEPTYPRPDQLSATFVKLHRQGFSNKQIVDVINDQLKFRNSPFRMNLEKDDAIAQIGLTNGKEIVIPPEPIITTDKALDEEYGRVIKIAAECAEAFNAGNHDVNQFRERAKDATKNGLTYYQFLWKVDDALRAAKGPYIRLMAGTDGFFILRHQNDNQNVGIDPNKSKR